MKDHNQKHPQADFSGREPFPLWQKLVIGMFLSGAFLISALGLLECIGLFINVYNGESFARDFNLSLIAIATLIFTIWSVGSARLVADFIADWIFDQL